MSDSDFDETDIPSGQSLYLVRCQILIDGVVVGSVAVKSICVDSAAAVKFSRSVIFKDLEVKPISYSINSSVVELALPRADSKDALYDA